MTERERKRAHRRTELARRKAAGRCCNCGGPRACKPCSSRTAAYLAERRRRWDEQGLCTLCGGEREDEAKKRCLGCRQRNKVRCELYRAKREEATT